MNRSETYGTQEKARAAKDTETMVGNSIATLLAALALGLAALGLLVGFDIINVENPFESGALWLGSGVVSGLAANVFRREHHILDEDEVRTTSVRTSDTGSRRV